LKSFPAQSHRFRPMTPSAGAAVAWQRVAIRCILAARMIFDKSPDIDHRTIGGEAFVITGGNAKIHSMNEVGTFVFDACDGATDVIVIVERVVEAFEVNWETAQADVTAFVLALEQRGMLRRRG
jgi:hypothetical protein